MGPYHEIETEIRYLTPEEGGRKGVYSGYRGQFFYLGEDWDGIQFFPDVSDGVSVELGKSVRALVRFQLERWKDTHSKKLTVGMPFEIREGRRIVGKGVVTKV